jgi:hypothetical protein
VLTYYITWHVQQRLAPMLFKVVHYGAGLNIWWSADRRRRGFHCASAGLVPRLGEAPG